MKKDPESVELVVVQKLENALNAKLDYPSPVTFREGDRQKPDTETFFF
ncbi:hypothetical protein H6G96_32645 [Nostoc sp. FACHB-892]|nr:hypothetical protein [Nostoc sp. FACHB-892]MBD2730941.1 hypothetical protein [Nostoc sp. FACHB-892]